MTPGNSAPNAAIDMALAKKQIMLENGSSVERYYLPASLIKGSLRACAAQLVAEKILEQDVVEDGWGSSSGSRKLSQQTNLWKVANEPERGKIGFSDLILEDEPQRTKLRTQRVEIDPMTGAAKDGNLAFVECPFEFGTEVTFKGELIFTGQESIFRDAVEKCLSRLFAVGAMKSVGFGRTIRTELGPCRPIAKADITAPDTSLRVGYRIDRPFIVDTERYSGNLSVGSEVIPGSAIKALIARGFEMAGLSKTDFISRLHVGHARVANALPLPLSLSISDSNLFCHLEGSKDQKMFHRFAPNWKPGEETSVRRALGSKWCPAELERFGTTRTEIDDASLTSKFDEENDAGLLFSQVSIDPAQNIFYGDLICPNGSDDISDVISVLASGLPGLGKTGAVLSTFPKLVSVRKTIETPDEDQLRLTLLTDACLFLPKVARKAPIRELYKKYFEELGMELETFFATQCLKGGYLSLRYPADPNVYEPWILTNAGSTFRVKISEKSRITDILNFGLPPALGTSDQWREFPFLRENGFGQVAHNLVDHTQLKQGLEL